MRTCAGAAIPKIAARRVATPVALLLATALGGFAAASAHADDLPACDDEEVVDTVLDAFFYATGEKAEIVTLEKIEEIGVSVRPAESEWSEVRGCAAQAQLTTGQRFAAWYRIVLPRIPDLTGYRVEMCTAEHDPVHTNCKAFETMPD